MPRRFESVGDGMPKWEPAPDRGHWGLSDPRLSNPGQDAKDVLLWSREELGVNVAICPCLHSFLTHSKHHPFENKVWEIYIFIKKCIVRYWSRHYSWLCSCIYLYMYACSCMWLYNTNWNLNSRCNCSAHYPWCHEESSLAEKT